MKSHLENNLAFSDKTGNYSYMTNRLAWGAIIAGTIVSLGYETLFNFLGIGLGLASLNSQNPHVFNLGSGVSVWLAINGIISMGIGGWFTGKFSNIPCRFKRGCHGIIAWSLATFLTVMIATTVSSALMGGAINMINASNTQVLAQTSTGGQSGAIPNKNFSVEGQQDNPDKPIGTYAGNLGKASIAMFLAFFMSGIASVMGAILASSGKHKKTEMNKI